MGQKDRDMEKYKKIRKYEKIAKNIQFYEKIFKNSKKNIFHLKFIQKLQKNIRKRSKNVLVY